jgi:hypothetical protein
LKVLRMHVHMQQQQQQQQQSKPRAPGLRCLTSSASSCCGSADTLTPVAIVCKYGACYTPSTRP